jgi:predicted nuclease with TOPRIM domain
VKWQIYGIIYEDKPATKKWSEVMPMASTDVEEVRIPPYYERFQEEREKRFTAEIARLEAAIKHNGQRIDELREGIIRLEDKVMRLEDKVERLRAEMSSQFRWTIGLLLPIVIGVVAIIIRDFLL